MNFSITNFINKIQKFTKNICRSRLERFRRENMDFSTRKENRPGVVNDYMIIYADTKRRFINSNGKINGLAQYNMNHELFIFGYSAEHRNRDSKGKNAEIRIYCIWQIQLEKYIYENTGNVLNIFFEFFIKSLCIVAVLSAGFEVLHTYFKTVLVNCR
jgi:hypothetical protein